MRTWKCLSVVMLLNVACWAQNHPSGAESLMACLPDDTVFCIAGGSLTELKPQLEQSVLGRFYRDEGVRTFVQGIVQGVSPQLEQEFKDINGVDIALDAARDVANCSRLLAMGYQERAEGLGVYGVLLLDAEEHKAQMSSWVTQLEEHLDPDEFETRSVGAITIKQLKDDDGVPVYWAWIGDRFLVAVNDAGDNALRAVQKSAWKGRTHLSKVSTRGDLMVGYADFPGLITLMQETLAAEDEQEVSDAVKQVWQALGLGHLREKIVRISIADSGLAADAYVSFSGPRQGLMAMMHPVKADVFQVVDASAIEAFAWNWDWAGTYDLILNTVRQLSEPEDFNEIRQGITELERQLDLSIRQDLLEPLSGPMVVYTMPPGSVPQVAMGGAICVAKLTDPEAFTAAVQKVLQLGAALSQGQLQVSTQTISGRTYHCWALPAMAMVQAMPTWTIVDNYWVCSTNVPLCAYGADRVQGHSGQSLASNESFVNLCAEVPTQSLLTLGYTDSRIKMQATYQALQQIWPMATMMAAQAQVQLPFILPSINHLIEDLKPAMTYTWEDAQGIHAHLQGATVELGAIAGVSLGAGILMPALARTRQLAVRMTSGTNLSAIGKACLVYACDHEDDLPPDLETLVQEDYLDAALLRSKMRQKNADDSDYLYISQSMDNDHRNIVAYDNPKGLKAYDGVNVLYLDCHVQFIKMDEFEQQLDETYQRLGRKRPEDLGEPTKP